MSIIEVNHVTKEYRLGHMKSLKQSVLGIIDRLRRRAVPKQEPFKALDEVDFKVEEGEVLGIIGTNGAGKSTLLKLLALVSTPTKGGIKLNANNGNKARLMNRHMIIYYKGAKVSVYKFLNIDK